MGTNNQLSGRGAMRWEGQWLLGNTPYRKFSVVNDDGWLMIANKLTSDKAAPYPIGEAIWASELVGTPSFTEQQANTSQLIVGQRYTYPLDGYASAVRFWLASTAVGTTVELWKIENPTTSPRYQVIVPSFTVTSNDINQWITIPIGLLTVRANTTFDVALLIQPATGTSSFSWEWDYERKNGNPDSGKAWHQSGSNQDQIRFHQTDKNGTNRTSDLDNIGPGSTITMVSSGQKWDVISASKSGSVYTFIVDPPTRAGSDTSFFTFEYPAVAAIDYEVDAGFYASESAIGSIFSSTGYENVVVANDAFGVDLEYQEMQQSDDWDTMLYGGVGAPTRSNFR